MHRRLWLCGTILGLHLVACGGREASRYTGSLMDDSAADSASTLTFTLWPASDSTFVGHVRIAQPVGRGGTVTAWHEGATLKAYSSSADGDTIVWTSAQSADAIGGTYEVVAGVSAGQGGTWRARLQSGPDASAATLTRAARGNLVPPIDAVWPGLALVALVAACVRWVRAAPVPLPDAVKDPLGAIDRSVGGWMAFFMFGQLVSIAMVAYHLPDFLDFLYTGVWQTGAAVMGIRGAIVVEKLAMLARLAAPLLGLWLITKRSRYAPRFWVAYLVLLAAYLVLDHLAGEWIHRQSVDMVGPKRTDTFDETRSRESFTTLRTAVILLLWSMYWCNSARVRSRFGYAAMDKPDESPPAADVALAG